MIIFEGPDGAGKTTLIQAFRERFDIPIAQRVVSKDTQALVDLRDWVDENLDRGFQYKIYDRHRLISETIYGPILRPKAEPGFSDLAWLAPRMQRFYDLQPIIVYCLPPLDEVMVNIVGDFDNTAVVKQISSIYSAYVARAAIDLTRLSAKNVKVWDYMTSPKIFGNPIWFNEVHTELRERTRK